MFLSFFRKMTQIKKTIRNFRYFFFWNPWVSIFVAFSEEQKPWKKRPLQKGVKKAVYCSIYQRWLWDGILSGSQFPGIRDSFSPKNPEGIIPGIFQDWDPTLFVKNPMGFSIPGIWISFRGIGVSHEKATSGIYNYKSGITFP